MLSRIINTPKNNLHTHNKAQALLLQRQCPNKGMQHTKMSNRTTCAATLASCKEHTEVFSCRVDYQLSLKRSCDWNRRKSL